MAVRQLNVAVVGLGNVGMRLVERMAAEERHLGRASPFRLVSACSLGKMDTRRFEELGVHFSEDYHDVLQAENVDIVVETIGGVSTAADVVSGALDKGKHVVTNNVALMASQGEQLARIAADKNVHLRFEGALIGFSPVMTLLRRAFAVGEVVRVYGALAGVSNYVLGRMLTDGSTVEKAVKAAVELGVAPDASGAALDVSGRDTYQRMVLLRALSFGLWAGGRDVKQCVGLDVLLPADALMAFQLGYHLKLLGMADVAGVRVAPYLVDAAGLLGCSAGNMTAFVAESRDIGSVFWAGRSLDLEATVEGILTDLRMTAYVRSPVDLMTYDGLAERAARVLHAPCGTDVQSAAEVEGGSLFYVRFESLQQRELFRLPVGVVLVNEVKAQGCVGLLLRTAMPLSELAGVVGAKGGLLLEVLG